MRTQRSLGAIIAATFLVVIAVGAVPAVALGQDDTEIQSPAEAREADLKAIAQSRGWTVQQARAQSQADDAIDIVARQVAAQRPDIFIGSALSKAPGGAPSLYIKGPASKFVRDIVADAAVTIKIVDDQPFSFDELENRKRKVHGPLAPNGRTRSRYLTAVGWMPQRILPIAGLTCREQVAYVGWLKGLRKSAAWTAAGETLERLSLSDLADRRASQISGGQLRRVGLAQTLVSGPSVILLDEPTAGLDPANRAAFRELVARLPASISVLISTHQVDDLDELFDDVAVLVDGRIAWNDSVDRFMAHGIAGSTRVAESAYLRIVGAG